MFLRNGRERQSEKNWWHGKNRCNFITCTRLVAAGCWRSSGVDWYDLGARSRPGAAIYIAVAIVVVMAIATVVVIMIVMMAAVAAMMW